MKLSGFLILAIVVSLASCSKAPLEEIQESPNLFRYGNFENQVLSLDLWSKEGDGDFNVVDLESYEGKFAMQVNPESCMQLFYSENIYVEAGQLYELSLALKMEGDQTNCSGDFIMNVYQDSASILQFNINKSNAENWVVKKYYITPVSDAALEFEIISGVKNSYLDDIRLKKVEAIN